MDPILSPSEGMLLRYLFDHSGGHGERVALDPKSVLRGLRIGMVRFEVDAGALMALGFVGTRRFRPNGGDGTAAKPTNCSAVWITGAGETFVARREFSIRRANPTPTRP